MAVINFQKTQYYIYIFYPHLHVYVYININIYIYIYAYLHVYLYLYMSWLWPGFQASYSPTLAFFFASIKAPTTLHSQLVGALADVETTRMLYKA